MDSEVQAAKRLTANSWDQYIPSTGQKRDWFDISGEILLDGRCVAEAYLAEHPADDDKPIDAAWLESVGFVWCNQYVNSDRDRMLYYKPLNLRWEVLFRSSKNEEHRGFSLGTRYDVELPTRGHVRRLCEVLGAPLSERVLAATE